MCSITKFSLKPFNHFNLPTFCFSCSWFATLWPLLFDGSESILSTKMLQDWSSDIAPLEA